jgi:hypothetical protein
VQSSFEQLSQMNTHKKPSERVKACLTLEAVDKDLEGRINRRVPEIFQARPTPRLGAQRITVQQPQLPAKIIAECLQTSSPRK